MRVLIGYDGSESSDVIFDDLKFAGLPGECEAMIVTVADLPAGSPPPVKKIAAQSFAAAPGAAVVLERAEIQSEPVKQAEEIADEVRDRLSLLFPEWNIEKRVITGTPAEELITAADDWNADLIVIGSRGRSGANRLLLGSVSQKVVDNSRRSVRVARYVPQKRDNIPPRVIIGIDGSSAAEAAVLAVGRREWQAGTQVRLVAVRDKPSKSKIASLSLQTGETLDDYRQSQAKRADEMIQWATYHLKALNLNVSMSVQSGDAKGVLLRDAQQWKADCIVVGTRDFKKSFDFQKPFERLRPGSVSNGVARDAYCSVEVVRQADSE